MGKTTTNFRIHGDLSAAIRKANKTLADLTCRSGHFAYMVNEELADKIYGKSDRGERMEVD